MCTLIPTLHKLTTKIIVRSKIQYNLYFPVKDYTLKCETICIITFLFFL
jgi:hypothetical protein